MRFMAALFALMTMSWVVACSARDPVADNALAANVPASINDPTPAPEGGPPPAAAPQPSDASTAPPAAIPASLQGSWGLTPADCTPTKGDAKGLLVITAAGLKFYESRAVPSPGVTADHDSITGNFAFTGEGQHWTKFATFERQKNRLVRTESNPAASYSYAKC
jgi:hypothetical protein